jgi:AraC family transcriptional regulator
VQSRPAANPDPAPNLSDTIPLPPTLTSYEVGWSSATLERYYMPPGENPEFCVDHYIIGIFCEQGFQIETKVDGVANGRLQKLTYFNGGTFLLPWHHSVWARWQQPYEAIVLNLKSDLLTDRAAELLAVDQLELLPRTLLDDPLILQIALALKADLESRRQGGRLYTEMLTNTNTLSVHRPTQSLSLLSVFQAIDRLHSASIDLLGNRRE